MPERRDIYFASDVHLGLRQGDPAERESRFVSFLKRIDTPSTKALYLLGDIWDFWYEYRDVVPREGSRVVAAIINLLDSGVKVYFVPGNHDIWCYSYFESLGMVRISQPFFFDENGKSFCIGHGDMLGGAPFWYGVLQRIFHCHILQRLFSTIHPTLSFRLGTGWSRRNRSRHEGYVFDRDNSPLYSFAESVASGRRVDFFVFGHLHREVDTNVGEGSRFIVLKDWMDGGMPHAVFSGACVQLRSEVSPSE